MTVLIAVMLFGEPRLDVVDQPGIHLLQEFKVFGMLEDAQRQGAQQRSTQPAAALAAWARSGIDGAVRRLRRKEVQHQPFGQLRRAGQDLAQVQVGFTSAAAIPARPMMAAVRLCGVPRIRGTDQHRGWSRPVRRRADKCGQRRFLCHGQRHVPVRIAGLQIHPTSVQLLHPG